MNQHTQKDIACNEYTDIDVAYYIKQARKLRSEAFKQQIKSLTKYIKSILVPRALPLKAKPF